MAAPSARAAAQPPIASPFADECIQCRMRMRPKFCARSSDSSPVLMASPLPLCCGKQGLAAKRIGKRLGRCTKSLA